MPKRVVQANRLEEPQCQYISLVTRGANRIPFKIVKSDKEDSMNINLANLFRKQAQAAPTIVAIAIKDDSVRQNAEEFMVDAGFSVDNFEQQEDSSIVYKQDGFTLDGVTPVSVSDAITVLVKDSTLQSLSLYKDNYTGTTQINVGYAVQTVNGAIVAKSEEESTAALEVFKSDVAIIRANVPGEVFELAANVEELYKACASKDKTVGMKEKASAKAKPKPEEGTPEEENAETSAEEEQEVASGEGDAKDKTKKPVKKEDEAQAEEQVVEVPAEETATEVQVEESVQKAATLESLQKSIQESFTKLTALLETQSTRLDKAEADIKETVEKTEKVSNKLIASSPEDDSVGSVKKQEVTRVSDTAYLRKHRR